VEGVNADLAGKVVLITGSSGAVGQATLETFLQHGSKVVLADVTAPPAPILENQQVRFVAADVADPGAVIKAVDAAIEHFGGLDAAVLAAGIEGPVGPVEDISATEIQRVLEVNVKGCLFSMQPCLRHMKRQKCGSIVAVSSISGVVGAASMAAYTISKHAVLGLVRAAALESGPFGVRINAVCPGPIESAMMARIDQAFLHYDPQRFGGSQSAAKSLPLQRYVSAVDVARMIAFLCSDDSASCHGGAYMVDAGFTAK
jgi:NAD(P)-dependent dehydrogenase (short-subunit alcohol dehydrogenase family)